MGIALSLALESHHNKQFDLDRAVSIISQGSLQGFFPQVTSGRRRR
jgi:hypothetical protein